MQVFWVLPSAVLAQAARGNFVASLLYHALLYYYPVMSAWLLAVLAYVVEVGRALQLCCC
jgi:hypothetical protein